MRLLERYIVLMTVPPLIILGPDDPNGLVKAGKLPVTGNLPLTYITGNLTMLNTAVYKRKIVHAFWR